MAPDEASLAEGIAGRAWAVNQGGIVVEDLPELGENPDDSLVQDYADKTHVSPYLTEEEESRTSKSDYPDFDLCFGKYSDRMIGMETNCLPAWDDIMETLSAARKRVNHYVAWTVLRDFWPVLLDETRKLREANR